MTTKIPDGRAAAVPRGITRPRAACSAHEGDSLEITVVADQRHWPDLEPRLAGVAAVATDVVPSDRRSGSCRPSNGNANRRANALEAITTSGWRPTPLHGLRISLAQWSKATLENRHAYSPYTSKAF